MPNYNQRVVNTFIKGLITEAGEMTFPENASVDELNCELFRDGSRRRRKGFMIESNNSNSTFNITAASLVSFGEWSNVSNDADKTYLVVQVDQYLHFYDKTSAPYSDQEVTGSIDLSTYQVSGKLASNFKCQFESVRGVLVVVSEAINPIYVEEDAGVFSATEIKCYERDYVWLGNRSEYISEVASASVSPEREYDTLNCGWHATSYTPTSTEFSVTWTTSYNPLGTYTSGTSNFPPLTHPWFSGKDSAGNFTVAEWKKIYSGTSILGNGRFIYNVWSKDRTAVSGVSGLTVITEASRFKCVTSFSERVFYSGLTSKDNSGKIYFTGILQDLDSLGKFYQVNDPTSEEISDLLADDGGVINIPDAVDIKKLYAFKNSIFAFAENGVWQITGVDNSFKATGYTISKVTDVGIVTPTSFVSAEGVPFWWSRHGIHTLTFDEVGNPREQNVSLSTIQSFWNEIDTSAKVAVEAGYDRINKKLIWLYPSEGLGETLKKNRLLILDVALQAFYPWEIVDKDVQTDYVIGMQFYSGLGTEDVTFDVITSAGDDVVTSAGDDVVSLQESPLSGTNISMTFFVRDSSENKMTMGFFSSDTFLDWGESNYSSYAETGYDFMGEVVLKKTAPYLVTYLRETETGWSGNETAGYAPLNESSLLVSAYWDFKKVSSSGTQQAYRRQQPILVDSSDLTSFDSPASVVTNRMKLRGRGRSLRLRIESEQGKDFIYLGHGLIVDAASRF